jgi:hypothetical protein
VGADWCLLFDVLGLRAEFEAFSSLLFWTQFKSVPKFSQRGVHELMALRSHHHADDRACTGALIALTAFRAIIQLPRL